MSNYSGNSLLTGIYAGLTNTYSYLAQLNPDGVTLESISNARTDSKNYLNLNQSFASYLQTNFNSIDKDGDGVIGADELTNFTNMLSSKGVTRTELSQLAASGASGLSSDMVNNILEHFDEMDTNHDGRITSAEISAYSYGASKQEKIDEFNHQRATNMSTFYSDDSSSSSVDSYSMLSYRYKNYNK